MSSPFSASPPSASPPSFPSPASQRSASALPSLLATAFDQRQDLLARLAAEATTAYRLFHGSAENCPGLTVDRYQDLLLIQRFHRPLSPAERREIEVFYQEKIPGLSPVYNDRSQAHSRICNPLPADELLLAQRQHVFFEIGVRYLVQGRHAGQDPWLFLDMRAGRRRIMQEAAGKSLLNLFAYTGGIGVAAAKAGATFVLNVDFAQSSLDVGKANARLNELPIRPRFILSDAFAAMRQLAGIGQPKVVRRKAMPEFPKLDARQFDLVFLDPPRYAKSAFGVVDIVNDYAALMKLALLCTAPGGTLICANNAAQISRAVWGEQLTRCAQKIGRPVRDIEWIAPEADFPSVDGQPPLKIALLRV